MPLRFRRPIERSGQNMVAVIRGTPDDDTLSGTPGADTFNISQGGSDTVTGDAGNDNFILGDALDASDRIEMGAALTAGDSIEGGAGNDRLLLDGDYSGAGAVVLAATTLLNVEYMAVSAGHAYDITSDDATVTAGGRLIVDGSFLGA